MFWYWKKLSQVTIRVNKFEMLFGSRWKRGTPKVFWDTICGAPYWVDKKYMMLFSPDFKHKVDPFNLYTYLQNKRMRRCEVAPPPIIFERLKLPQQIIYLRKENLSESPNHQKYWENILVSRFYEQFSRNRRNLGHFRKFEKISNS